jgi:hypothetical protein
MNSIRATGSLLFLLGSGCAERTPEGGQEGEPLVDSGGTLPAMMSGTVIDNTIDGIPANETIVIELRDHAATIDGWPDATMEPVQTLGVVWLGQETAWSTLLGAEDASGGVLIFALWDDGDGDLYNGARGRYASDLLVVEDGTVVSGLTISISDFGDP